MNAYFYRPNILIIKTPDTDKVKTFFETLGLKFIKEKHGDGPEHYATVDRPEIRTLLEIYPE